MLVFPNAKINLGLHILNKREDGYHNIETVMLPIGLSDALEIIPTNSHSDLITTGLDVDVQPEQNLCMKAYQVLALKYNLPPIHIYLHKVIPSGAGLGGGSADASFMLKSLNSYFNINLSKKELIDISSGIGSDCPFFIENSPSISTGRGEILESFEIDLTNYFIIVIHPGIHINTSWAYTNSTPVSGRPSIKSVLSTQDLSNWKKLISNDFEKVVFSKYPEIKKIKEQLYSEGALYASMTGSGSAVYGIFNNNPDLLKQKFDCFSWTGKFIR